MTDDENFDAKLRTPDALSCSPECSMYVPVNAIEIPPSHPRRTFEAKALRALAASIKHGGIQCPISVKSDPRREGHYILNHGARRLRAATIAGLERVPIIVDQSFDALDILAGQFQQTALSFDEITTTVHCALDRGIALAQVARVVGRSSAWVKRIKEARDLLPELQELLDACEYGSVEIPGTLAKCWVLDAKATARYLQANRGKVIRRSSALTFYRLLYILPKPRKAAKSKLSPQPQAEEAKAKTEAVKAAKKPVEAWRSELRELRGRLYDGVDGGSPVAADIA